VAGAAKQIVDVIAAGTALTAGTDLFVGRLPEAPIECVSVLQYPGEDPKHTHGGSDPAVEMPRVTVFVRSTSQSTAWTLSQAIRKLIRWYDGTVLGTVIHNVAQIGDLMELDPGPGETFRISGSYEITRDPE
jgi:hypothetical protein